MHPQAASICSNYTLLINSASPGHTSPPGCQPKIHVRSKNSTNSFICDRDKITHRVFKIIHRWKVPIPACENRYYHIVQCKMRNKKVQISFVTKIRTLVRVEILYVALNMMHLIMKSVTNIQVLGKKLSISNAFHDQCGNNGFRMLVWVLSNGE